MKTLRLSWDLTPDSPVYGNGIKPVIRQTKNMNQGDTANSSELSFGSHSGTHIDSSFHFFPYGKPLTGYEAGFWIFSNPVVCELTGVQPGHLVSPSDLASIFPQVNAAADLLLIKTGFCSRRNETVYWENNPGFTPELADWLRQQFPGLRAVGFDSISLSSYQNRMTGREAHRAFLQPGKEILIIEDADLTQISRTTVLTEVIISPLFTTVGDGSPVTIFAKVSHD